MLITQKRTSARLASYRSSIQFRKGDALTTEIPNSNVRKREGTAVEPSNRKIKETKTTTTGITSKTVKQKKMKKTAAIGPSKLHPASIFKTLVNSHVRTTS
jgi:hypothetical protein